MPTLSCGLDGRAAVIPRDSLWVDFCASIKQETDQTEIPCVLSELRENVDRVDPAVYQPVPQASSKALR